MIKKLLDNLTAPEKGKVSDKTMSSNIIACVIGVLLCVVSLTAATLGLVRGFDILVYQQCRDGLLQGSSRGR